MTTAKTSKCPRLDLLPREGLIRVAGRFEKGLVVYGLDNWRQGLADVDYVCERLAHGIDHAYRLIAKLRGYMPDDGDDDAAALAWAGLFACCAKLQLGPCLDLSKIDPTILSAALIGAEIQPIRKP